MKISAISFGNVIAVSGKNKRMRKINKMLQPYTDSGQIMIKDVTRNYFNASSAGILAGAAQRGERVNVYITGDDVKKVMSSDEQWDTTEKILSNLCTYYDANTISAGEAAKKIINS